MSATQPSTALTLLRDRTELQRRRLTLIRPSSIPINIKIPTDFELGLGITELAGSAGCGKTQIALGICVECACTQLKSKEYSHSAFGKALYVSLGEGTTQLTIAKRLHQIAENRKVELNLEQQEQPTNAILKNILTRMIRNQDEFEQFVNQDLPEILRKDKDIAFLAMDSIASMFRIYDSKRSFEAAVRSGKLFKIAAQLKKLSEEHQLPMLIVNQVTADFSSGNGKSVLPALGLSWTNCINESYFVSREESNPSFSGQVDHENVSAHLHTKRSQFQRTIRCRFSPSRFPCETSFVIDDGGAKAIAEVLLEYVPV